ncbi:hypothetical protein B0H13DRAFT_2370306 [Mycena leptocephala]|nr:hypothetical protein B0H13DRAFT_2370306 [Mycena leptocephala]
MSKAALACHPNQHFVLTSPIPINRDIPRAFTHIAADYIQHNPFKLDGTTSSFDFLYPIFSNTSVTVQILHRVFEAPFNGTCVQEHWDVIQERPANATNPHPLF